MKKLKYWLSYAGNEDMEQEIWQELFELNTLLLLGRSGLIAQEESHHL
jgi:hypothetical protein